jgi:hypothetical protein
LIDSQDTLSFSLLTSVRAMTEVFPLERAAEAYEHMMNLEQMLTVRDIDMISRIAISVRNGA